MKIKNVGSNQTEVCVDGTIVFYSYSTPVAANVNGALVRTDKFHSNTTSRHINKWFNGAKADIVSQEYLDSLLDK